MKPDAVRVAFFSRGRGRGHVVPDMAIAEELCELDKDIEITWVSYGTGAVTLRDCGYSVVDLNLPDQNPFLETHLRAIRLLSRMRPELVISHEEFAAAPAAKLFDIPVVFITDYFFGQQHIWTQSICYADEILFIDKAGFFDVPSGLQGKTRFVGPIVRRFAYTRKDRERARSELGLSQSNIVVLVLPGSWSESRSPIADLVETAFRVLTRPEKTLVWIAGQDYLMLSDRFKNVPDVMVREADWQIDRLMVACDVAITKGTRKTSLELSSLGIPSISLSNGLNRVDDVRVSQIPTNTHLRVEDLDGVSLAQHIDRVFAAGRQHDSMEPPSNPGLAQAALRLSEHIDIIRKKRRPDSDVPCRTESRRSV